MSLGISGEAFEKRKTVQPGQRVISDRAYNTIIGGLLTWGLLLNYLMIRFLERPILNLVAGMNPLVIILLYFGLVIVGSFMIRNESPATSLIGFHLIAVPVGVVVCVALQGYYTETVRSAVLLTGAVTLLFTVLGITYPAFFLRMGRVLGIALLASIVVEVLSLLILRRGFAFMDWIIVAIFSLYIGFDWARANTCARTVSNAVDLAANLYLDIINIFLRLLSILGRRRD